jgi:hypothetical protein
MKRQEKQPGKYGEKENQAINLHPKIDKTGGLLAGIATFLCIIGYICSLDTSSHNIVSLWSYCFAGIVTCAALCHAFGDLWLLFIVGAIFCVGLCFYLEGKWLALDEMDKPVSIASQETNEVSSATSIEYLPGPRQITDQIANAEPFQQDAVAKSFDGASVDWKLYLNSIHRSTFVEEKGELQIGLVNTPSPSPSICVVYLRVPMVGNESLSLLKKDSLVRVKGVIQSASSFAVDLKDGATLEPVETK